MASTYRLLLDDAPAGDDVYAALTALAMRRLDPSDPAVDARTFGAWLRSRGESSRSIG